MLVNPWHLLALTSANQSFVSGPGRFLLLLLLKMLSVAVFVSRGLPLKHEVSMPFAQKLHESNNSLIIFLSSVGCQ
jgi:hypothetical protein